MMIFFKKNEQLFFFVGKITKLSIRTSFCKSRFTMDSGLRIVCHVILLVVLVSNCSMFSSKTKEGKTVERSRFDKPKQVVLQGVVVNQVRYVIGSEAITDLDIKQMKERLRKSRKKGRGSLKKRAINELIERAIVAIEAEKQTIIISDLRLENEVRRRMQRMGITSEEKFRKITRRTTGISFEIWLEEMHYDLTKQQLVRVALSVPPATNREIERFYNKNKRKVGVEIRYREMIFVPKGGIRSESETSRSAQSAYKQVRSDPRKFAEVARSNPANVATTKAYGGLHNFVELSGIAENNRILAGVLYNTGVGQVSRVFRDIKGRYMIIKLEGRRPVSISKVRDLIRQRLHFEKQGEIFDIWMKKRKAEIAIVVVK